MGSQSIVISSACALRHPRSLLCKAILLRQRTQTFTSIHSQSCTFRNPTFTHPPTHPNSFSIIDILCFRSSPSTPLFHTRARYVILQCVTLLGSHYGGCRHIGKAGVRSQLSASRRRFGTAICSIELQRAPCPPLGISRNAPLDIQLVLCKLVAHPWEQKPASILIVIPITFQESTSGVIDTAISPVKCLAEYFLVCIPQVLELLDGKNPNRDGLVRAVINRAFHFAERPKEIVLEFEPLLLAHFHCNRQKSPEEEGQRNI